MIPTPLQWSELEKLLSQRKQKQKQKQKHSPRKRAIQVQIWHSIWLPILHSAIDNKVSARHIAQASNLHPTLIHKYSCRKCEHFNTPRSYNLRSLTQWLAAYHAAPYCSSLNSVFDPVKRYRGGCTKQMRNKQTKN